MTTPLTTTRNRTIVAAALAGGLLTSLSACGGSSTTATTVSAAQPIQGSPLVACGMAQLSPRVADNDPIRGRANTFFTQLDQAQMVPPAVQNVYSSDISGLNPDQQHEVLLMLSSLERMPRAERRAAAVRARRVRPADAADRGRPEHLDRHLGLERPVLCRPGCGGPLGQHDRRRLVLHRPRLVGRGVERPPVVVPAHLGPPGDRHGRLGPVGHRPARRHRLALAGQRLAANRPPDQRPAEPPLAAGRHRSGPTRPQPGDRPAEPTAPAEHRSPRRTTKFRAGCTGSAARARATPRSPPRPPHRPSRASRPRSRSRGPASATRNRTAPPGSLAAWQAGPRRARRPRHPSPISSPRRPAPAAPPTPPEATPR